MASIREELIALAEKIKGEDGLSADDIASAIALITENYTPHQAANQAASTAADLAGLKEDFNDLLDALKEAGLMAADAAGS